MGLFAPCRPPSRPSASHEDANARTDPLEPQRAVLEPARGRLGGVRPHAVLWSTAVREALELRARDRGLGDRRLRAVDADALHLPAAVEPATARAHPRRARDLLHHGARAAYRHQPLVQGIRRARLAGTDAV